MPKDITVFEDQMSILQDRMYDLQDALNLDNIIVNKLVNIIKKHKEPTQTQLDNHNTKMNEEKEARMKGGNKKGMGGNHI